MSTKEGKDGFVNPIDDDKITDRPGLLQYAHHLGSAIIKPIDEGRTKGVAMAAMFEQTGNQLNQLREQVEVLVRQAKDIHHRIYISEKIYKAEMRFEPTIMKNYHLYRRKNDSYTLSLIAPTEWRKNPPYNFVASVKLLSDHTWEVMEMAEEII